MKKVLTLTALVIVSCFLGCKEKQKPKSLSPDTPVSDAREFFLKGEQSVWRASPGRRVFGKPGSKPLTDYINGAAELFYEYGFEFLVTRDFTDGEVEIVVDIYCMKTPAGAYGIFSINRGLDAPSAGIGSVSSDYGESISFVQGLFMVNCTADSASETARGGVRLLAETLAEEMSLGKTDTPPFVQTSDTEYINPNSIVLVRGKIGYNNHPFFPVPQAVDFENGAMLIMAGGEIGGEKVTQSMIACASHVQTAESYRVILEKLKEKLAQPAESSSLTTTFRNDERFTALIREEKRRRILYVSGPLRNEELLVKQAATWKIGRDTLPVVAP
ncbi:DUF6599 family protein [Candidatus Hydrogenedentota bacterium]